MRHERHRQPSALPHAEPFGPAGPCGSAYTHRGQSLADRPQQSITPGVSGSVVVRSLVAPLAVLAGLISVELPAAYRETIPGTLVTFDMVLVPGDDPFY